MNTIFKKAILFFAVFFVVFISTETFSSYAQGPEGLDDSFERVTEIGNDSGVDANREPKDFIVDIIKIVTGLVAIIAAGVLIVGGVMYITAAGDESKAERAKMLIFYSVIGLIVIGVAGLVVNVIINTVISGN